MKLLFKYNSFSPSMSEPRLDEVEDYLCQILTQKRTAELGNLLI